MSLLRARPATTPAMLEVWSDATTLAHALAFEAALARAVAKHELIADEEAEAIAAACTALDLDAGTLAEEAALAGTLAIPLVARLRQAVGGSAGARVHLGATSQDLADSVLMRQVRAASVLVAADARRIADALAKSARAEAGRPAMGRTLLQDALPIGFGLRMAQWCAGVTEAAERLAHEVAAGATLQFGGAVGTRAGLQGRGEAVARDLAAGLDLPPAPPWHVRRGGVAAIGAAVAILIGACAKMARDVSLLAQGTVGEAREPLVAGRGGSSAMAHKRNPTACQIALSAATRAPGLAAGLLSGLPAEAERGLGGWQAEAPALAELFLLAAGATDAMAGVAEGLEIDAAAIAHNLPAGDGGADLGESVALVDALLRSGN